jgi:hypothetical protein
MEKMPYRREPDTVMMPCVATATVEAPVTSTDWRDGLPVLRGKQVVLRELRPSDAASLFP